ncbi:MAG: cation diffusion facilitator family transporter [Porphyromonas sp.]|nr:cation diffusion facilitator family transporter [Porphyromonas sp.]
MAHLHGHGCCGHHHGHEHAHHDHHGHLAHGAGGNILVAFLLNLGFTIVELVGGLYTGSVAILSDALHDAGDCVSLGLAWYLERLSIKGRDKHFSYGYKRFSLLSALLISSILLVGSLIMIYTAIGKVLNPTPVQAEGMFALALLGIAINGYAAWRMMGNASLSDRALRLHLLEDVLGWVAVLVVSIVMYFVELPILDPLLSIVISLWILYNVYHNLRDTLHILLQGVPEGIDTEALEQELRTLPAVLDVHDIHVWTMNGQEHIASLHVVHSCEVCGDASAIAELKHQVRHIAEHHGLNHITIELDPEGEACGACCD